MKCAHSTATILAGLALSATQASAAWQWVEDGPSTQTEVTTEVYEEQDATGYYDQQPRTYRRETYREEAYVEPVVTDRQVFRDGRCDITRTHLSDGTFSDERVCSRLQIVPPHVFIIDRIGRHFDRLRGYDRY